MSKLYSDKQLITHIVELKNELGRVPGKRDMDKATGRPSGAIYQYRFGSWNKAIKKANMKTRNRYEQDELIEKLQELSKELGHTPRRIEINSSDYCPYVETYAERFGSYEEAIRAAGLTPSIPYVQITDEELLEGLREAVSKLKRGPTMREFFSMKKYPNPSTYVERFGSWGNALEMVGSEITGNRFPDEKLLQDLRDVASILGHTPSYWEMNAMKEYSNPRTIVDRFGPWSKSVAKAGLE